MKKMIMLTVMTLAFGVSQLEAQTYGSYCCTKKSSDVSVSGYYKPSTGTYVQPYKRSAPDRTKSNNFSTYGNTNPYTGSKGTKRSSGSSLWTY